MKWIKRFIDWLIPEGWEDEHGWHAGKPPIDNFNPRVQKSREKRR